MNALGWVSSEWVRFVCLGSMQICSELIPAETLR